MREWLSGRASPCQGERREFESRLPLHFHKRRKNRIFASFVSIRHHSQVVRQRSATPLCPGSNPGGASIFRQAIRLAVFLCLNTALLYRLRLLFPTKSAFFAGALKRKYGGGSYIVFFSYIVAKEGFDMFFFLRKTYPLAVLYLLYLREHLGLQELKNSYIVCFCYIGVCKAYSDFFYKKQDACIITLPIYNWCDKWTVFVDRINNKCL